MSDGFTPVIIRGCVDLAAVMKAQREARGETLLASDYRLGFHDGYTAHFEKPMSKTGRRGLRLSPMAEVWLSGHGLAIVVMTESQARTLTERAA